MTTQPAALRKAESLSMHAKHCGCPLGEFMVALSLPEAFEFLDYLLAECPVTDQELFEEDAAAAKLAGDPWPVIKDWQVGGFNLVPLEALH